MRVAVFGTSEFAVPVLERVAGEHDVVLVVTQPDRPAGRGQKLAATPVRSSALARGLRVETPEKLRPFAPTLAALAPDACVVASYGRIVPQALLDVVPLWLNVHPSPLPLYRGATPLQSAIRDGCTTTAVTIIAMDAGMDTGDVVLQETATIASDDTYGTLHDRLAGRGAALVVDALARAGSGALVRTPQTERARTLGIDAAEIARTTTRPLTKDDLMLACAPSAVAAANLVRALAPQPLARASVGADTLKVAAAHVTAADDGRALALRFADAWLVLDRIVPPGRGPMDGAAYARARRDRAGAGA